MANVSATHRRESSSGPLLTFKHDHQDLAKLDVAWPFGDLHGLNQDDIREIAYEIFFTTCRSSPGSGNRNSHSFQSKHDEAGSGSGSGRVGLMTPSSRVKKALGLKMIKKPPSRRMSSVGVHAVAIQASPGGSGGASPGYVQSRPRRPMTSAEIMRVQMRVTEQSDTRMRKTLTKSLVGQMSKRVDTIILPLELLRHLKPQEFGNTDEYHCWQKRQLKVLEAGLILFPSTPLEKSNKHARCVREIIQACETKPFDIGKNSDTMRTLSNSIMSLSRRKANGNTNTDACHWADGYPLNVHVYIILLQAIFDFRDETLVLDEVDELLELIKKTWSTLGISRPIHNICFSWVLFQQYIVTGLVEPDLLSAAHTMLSEVENDAKKPDREAVYMKMLSTVLSSMLEWVEKRLFNYHEYFPRGTAGCVENLVPLALAASRILGEDVTVAEVSVKENGDENVVDSSVDRIDHYIRSSINNAFQKIIEKGNFTSLDNKAEASEILIQLAKETEDLALRERESFIPILKNWHPMAGGLAVVTLHSCYGSILKQYLSGMATLSKEIVEVLQQAGKLEKVLVQMIVEDTAECEQGGNGVVRDMILYEVDSIISTLLGQWTEERLKHMRDCLYRGKQTETWNPKSKTEPYAHSAIELMRLALTTVEDFFHNPIGITEDLVYDLADGLEVLFQDYATFVASCGSKQSYIPTLPPLTRCSKGSKLSMFLKKVPCRAGGKTTYFQHLTHDLYHSQNHQHPRPSTSRGTQRLYIRLNTLHYLLSHLHALQKKLSLSPKISPSPPHHRNRHHRRPTSYFDMSTASIHAACQHVSEVAASSLIFLDSHAFFYESLYVCDVSNSRIRPALRILKQNLNLLFGILIDRAQPMAIKEVMKASFEAFTTVLLAGGSTRVFKYGDHYMINEDFNSLKRVFWSCGEGILNEETVNREAGTVEGVIDLMGQCTEQLIEDLSIMTCERSGIGFVGNYSSAGHDKLPMPPTTGGWNQSDPNTILRVLCHRDDRLANSFLKNTFQLAKRR